jgi:2-polyprenyl-6-methoxyphenol hydroxylase-like FAD-dependent oxidoreductase
MNEPLDVLIAGAGPTGTTLAIDLARRGLDVRIIDKATHSFEGSRAKGLQPRTLEVFDDLGALDDVLAGSSDYPRLGIHLGPVTVPWRMFRNRDRTAEVPYPNTRLMPQYRTDSVLHDRLEQLGGKVEYGRELPRGRRWRFERRSQAPRAGVPRRDPRSGPDAHRRRRHHRPVR